MSGASPETVLRLPCVADLTFAATLKSSLEKALVAGAGFSVDASEVRQITSPCLQVLAAAVKAFNEAGGPSLAFSEPSSNFLETVSMLGLASALGVTEI